MFSTQLFHKLLILRLPGIGPVKYHELIRKFGDATAVVESLQISDSHADRVQREMDAALQMGIKYISDDSPEYPANLNKVKNHPPIISVRGNLESLRQPATAIVGTRNATAAGMGFVFNLARAFADNGYSIVSGMAMGTDTAAHRGALASGRDLVTIAVLAGGVDYIWPLENERLYHSILERGALVSEMPVGFKPVANNFVQRNRLIAGIAEKLILGEADLKSGSVYTAGFSIEYGRPVHAIPGFPGDSRNAGPNKMIRDGTAKLCTGVADFFKMGKEKVKTENKKSGRNSILDFLGISPVSESVLAKLAEKDIDEIKRDLIVLEIDGLIRKTDSGYVKI